MVVKNKFLTIIKVEFLQDLKKKKHHVTVLQVCVSLRFFSPSDSDHMTADGKHGNLLKGKGLSHVFSKSRIYIYIHTHTHYIYIYIYIVYYDDLWFMTESLELLIVVSYDFSEFEAKVLQLHMVELVEGRSSQTQRLKSFQQEFQETRSSDDQLGHAIVSSVDAIFDSLTWFLDVYENGGWISGDHPAGTVWNKCAALGFCHLFLLSAGL